MLRVGLTGGIGAGKSEVARRLAHHGAVVVDADQLAREVVAPGTDGLREVVDVFGPDILGPDGGLDRDALGAAVFADDTARRRLEAIVHPRVRARSEELTVAAAHDAVVVQDVPLLVEVGLAPTYHLVAVVTAAEETRVARLTEARGLPVDQARARIGAQLADATRRAAADVVLENDADLPALHAAVDALWHERLVTYEANLRTRRAVCDSGQGRLVRDHARWASEYARLAARIRRAVGDDLRIDHVGATAVADLPAEDILDLQLTVPDLAAADALAEALADAGFPRLPGAWHDHPPAAPGGPDPDQPSADVSRWAKRMHGSADPGRAAHLHLRPVDSPGRRLSLLMRDWLRADPAARDEYARHQRTRAATQPAAAADAATQEAWCAESAARAESWAQHTGWHE